MKPKSPLSFYKYKYIKINNGQKNTQGSSTLIESKPFSKNSYNWDTEYITKVDIKTTSTPSGPKY